LCRLIFIEIFITNRPLNKKQHLAENNFAGCCFTSKMIDVLFSNEKAKGQILFSICPYSGSPCWARTNDNAVNSRVLYQLS
jgi:hypothetical protein